MIKAISKRAMAWFKPLDITAVTFDISTMPGYIDLNVKVNNKDAVAHLTLAQAIALKNLLNREIEQVKSEYAAFTL